MVTFALSAIFVIAYICAYIVLCGLLCWRIHSVQRLAFVVVWGEVVCSLGYLLRASVVYPTGNVEFSFSLGEAAVLVFPEVKGHLLYVVLSKADVFFIWEAVVVAIGLKFVVANSGLWRRIFIALLALIGPSLVFGLSLFESGRGGQN